MNYLVAKKIEEYERVSNRVEKVININYCLEFIVIFYSVIFYSFTRTKNLVNKDLIELVLTKFHKKEPLLGSWIKLLRICIDLQKLELAKFDSDIGVKIQIAAKSFLPDSSKKEIKTETTIKVVLESISHIRNKVFAHSNSIPSETVETLIQNQYEKLPYILNDYLEKLINVKILVAENIFQNNDEDHDLAHTFIDISDNIAKNISLLSSEIKNLEELTSKHLYLYFPESEQFISTSPFLIYRDECYFYYNGIDNKSHPVYTDIFNSTKNITIKKYENAFKESIQDDINILNSIDLPIKLCTENGVKHNLPTPTFEKFIGRTETIMKVIKALENKRIFLIGISGVGGVGKSALAIKTARDLIEYKKIPFSYIIWVSAKKTYLTPEGIKTETQVFSNLNQLLDLILKITGFTEGLNLSFLAKKEFCLDVLSLEDFLIIVDNFETLSNPLEFLTFFEDIADHCNNTKIIITTRHQMGSSEKIIDLKEFSINEYEEFINYLCSTKFCISYQINQNNINKLWNFTGGLPLATEFIIGQISDRNQLDKILTKIESADITKDNMLAFSYNESFVLLNENEKKVLFSIALIENPKLSPISFLTNLDEFDVEEVISKLKLISFVNEYYDNDETFYSILPLTRIFITKKLEDNQNLSQELQTKYQEYKYIIQFSDQVRESKFISDRLNKSKNMASMFAIAAYNSASQGNFQKSEEYFKKAIEYDPKESLVWFYWAKAERDFSHNIRDDYFENAVKFTDDEKNREEILLEWANTLRDFNKHKESINKYNMILDKNPDDKNISHLIGKTYYELGRNLYQKGIRHEMRDVYTKSKDAFEKCLYETPFSYFEMNHNAVSYYFLAKISRFLNKIDDSLKYIQQGLEIQPNNFRLQEFKDDLIKIKTERKQSVKL